AGSGSMAESPITPPSPRTGMAGSARAICCGASLRQSCGAASEKVWLDITASLTNVRFTPESGHFRGQSECPLRAKADICLPGYFPAANGSNLDVHSAAFRFAPDGEILERLLLGRWVEAKSPPPLHHFLGDEILIHGHFNRFGGELVAKIRRDHDHSFCIANDHVAWKHRCVAAGDRQADVDWLVACQVGRRRRPIVIGWNGELLDVRCIAKAA